MRRFHGFSGASLFGCIGVLLVLGFARAAVADADACVPRLERYVVSCRDGVCDSPFRITQVSAFGSCGRRPEVRDVDAATRRFLATLVEHDTAHRNGLFELMFSNSYWFDDRMTSFEMLGRSLDGAVPRVEGLRDREFMSFSPDEQVAMLNKARDGWIRRISERSSADMVSAERHRWERIAATGRWWNWGRWMASWTAFLAVFLILVHSVHAYFEQLYRDGAGWRKSLLVPAAVQVIIGLIGLCAALQQNFAWPIFVLLPAVVTVLLAEVWAWFRKKLARNEPA